MFYWFVSNIQIYKFIIFVIDRSRILFVSESLKAHDLMSSHDTLLFS